MRANRKRGLFETADGGTVFLDDEIGEMTPGLQATAALSRREDVQARGWARRHSRGRARDCGHPSRSRRRSAPGKFREDLFYRLQVMPVVLPSLRSRKGDVALLAKWCVERYNQEVRKRVRGLTPDAIAVLEQYGWPGNVRELRNVIERAMLLVEHDWLTPEDFSALPRGARGTTFKLPAEGLDLERDLLLQALDRTDWNQTHAGRLLGINRDQVRYRIEKFGLPPGRPAAHRRRTQGVSAWQA
jgi:two-component system, NtrC family, response regulator AtoC